MGGIDEWLERLSWIALILLPFLLVLGGYVALRHCRTLEQDLGQALQAGSTSRLIELLRLIDQQGSRDARSTVLIEIAAREAKGENWWKDDERLYRAAETVCISYDYIAGVINFDSSDQAGQFFLETWGEDVIRIHDILQRYLDFRRKSGAAGYDEFTWLAQEANVIHHNPPAAEPEHPIRTVIRHLGS